MTYSLVIVAAILGTWIIFHNNKTIGSGLNKMAILALLFQVIFRYISSYNTELALFALAKDAFILSSISALLIISKKNIFAQLGILSAAVYFLFSQVNVSSVDIPTQEIDPDWELLVKTEDGVLTNAANEFIEYYGINIERSFNPKDAYNTELDDYYSFNIPSEKVSKIEKILDELDDIDGIEWIEFNEKLYRLPLEPGKIVQGKSLQSVNDPMTQNQWSLQALNMDEYYNLFKSKNLLPVKKSKLFILDSGIFPDHEDLKEIFVAGRSKHSKDARGHGTHCAGIAAAISNNNKGIASMSPGKEWVELHSVKVINDYGFGTQKSIIDGIIEAVDLGADVINMSLGGKAYQNKEKAYEEAVAYAVSKNTIIVVAAGNSNDNAKGYLPAKLNDVITVTASDNTLNRASFSNYISDIKNGISAPGTEILSTFNDGSYKTFSGTSMASPHVAGLVAVFRSLQPDMDLNNAYKILHNTGIDTGSTKETGKLIQPSRAIREILDHASLNN